MRPIVIAEHESLIKIPELDPGLKSYFENCEYGLWVFDCVHCKVLFGNEAGAMIWGHSSVESFLGMDLTFGIEANREAGRIMVMDCLRRKEAFHPWVIHPVTGGAPLDSVLRITGISVDGHLHILGEMDSAKDDNKSAVPSGGAMGSSKQGLNSQISQVTHEAFKFSPSMMSIMSMSGELVYQNIAAEGYYRTIVPDYCAEVVEKKVNLLKQLLKGSDGKSAEYEKLMRCVSEGKQYGKSVIVPPFSMDNEIWHSLSICKERNGSTGESILIVSQIDVTESKQKDGKIMAMERSKKQQQKDRLIEAVGHELKTPLVGVIGLSDELLVNENLQAILHENRHRKNLDLVLQSIKLIHQSGKRLIGLVDTLLNLSQLKQNPDTLHYEYCDLQKIIDQVCNEHTVNVSISVIKSIPSDLPDMICDQKAIQRVLEILFGNAVKFTRRGFIKIHVQNRIVDNTGNAIISVIDSGIGIPEKDHDRIFDLFEQADNSTGREFQGAGAGLCLAKTIIEQHGGSIMLTSEVDKGSTFMFSLPYRPDALLESTRSPSTPTKMQGRLSNQNSVQDYQQRIAELENTLLLLNRE